jgi:hypothetical protein
MLGLMARGEATNDSDAALFFDYQKDKPVGQVDRTATSIALSCSDNDRTDRRRNFLI